MTSGRACFLKNVHALRALLLHCAFQKTLHLSVSFVQHLHLWALCVSSATKVTFIHQCCSKRRPAIASVLCSNHCQIDRTEFVSAQPEYFLSNLHSSRAHGEIVLKLLCPRRGIWGDLPNIRHSWDLVQARLPENCCQHLLVAWSSF